MWNYFSNGTNVNDVTVSREKAFPVSFLFFSLKEEPFLKIINLFIFGCVGSLLCAVFL